MKKLLLVFIALTMLAGCAQWQTFKTEGARITDGALEAGEWEMCTAATIGAIRRRYGVNEDMAAAWELFCEEVWEAEAGATVKPLTK